MATKCMVCGCPVAFRLKQASTVGESLCWPCWVWAGRILKYPW